ncbi:MAG: MraY family glycosyltransferase [Chthonomonadales bacterium]
MTGTAALLVTLASAAVGAVATGFLLPVLRASMVDIPNERSSHTTATPRGGGIGILAGAVAGLVVAGLLGWPLPGPIFLCAVGVVAAVGLLDDWFRGLPVWMRLAAQGAAAGLLVWRCGPVPALMVPGVVSVPLGPAASAFTVLGIVGAINLYNFLDGIDGFAGMQGLVAGAALGVAFWGSPVSAVGWAVAGACLGFLRYNWRPARVFMGDVGSTALGMTFGASPLLLPAAHRPAALFAVLLALWFFVSDGVFTLVRRLLRGERVWQAHRSHLYQRLVATGLRHDQLVITVMAPAALLAGCGAAGCRLHAAGVCAAAGGAAVAAFGAYWLWTISREVSALGIKRLSRTDRQVDTSPARRVQ